MPILLVCTILSSHWMCIFNGNYVTQKLKLPEFPSRQWKNTLQHRGMSSSSLDMLAHWKTLFRIQYFTQYALLRMPTISTWLTAALQFLLLSFITLHACRSSADSIHAVTLLKNSFTSSPPPTLLLIITVQKKVFKPSFNLCFSNENQTTAKVQICL